MNCYKFSVLLFITMLNLYGQKENAELLPGAKLLFGQKTKLNAADKNLLFKNLELKLSPDGKELMIEDFTVTTFVYPTDLNKDGREDIFVVLNSAALFGNVGENFVLYIQNEAGNFEKQSEIGGGPPVILSTKNLGFPDILVGTPNMEHPVYRWNGRTYSRHKKLKDAALNPSNSAPIEKYSKAYTNSK